MDAAPGFPMVLHGASGVPQHLIEDINRFGGVMPGAVGIPDEQLRMASQMAVCKINVASDLRIASTATIRRFLTENPEKFDPRDYLRASRQAMQELVSHKLHHVLGSAGKA
jgi:fructose-bisphosphate aldolase class II